MVHAEFLKNNRIIWINKFQMKYKVEEVKLCWASSWNKMKPGVMFIVKWAFCNKTEAVMPKYFMLESAKFCSMLRAIACNQERSVKFSTLVYISCETIEIKNTFDEFKLTRMIHYIPWTVILLTSHVNCTIFTAVFMRPM